MSQILYDASDIPRLRYLMALHGFREHDEVAKIETYLQIKPKRGEFARALKQATKLFRRRAIIVPKGLDSLPIDWLKALPHILWSLRKPHWDVLPFRMCEVCAVDGMLQLRFAQEPLRYILDEHVGGFDRIRIAVNAALYPSRWRPLKRRDSLLLAATKVHKRVRKLH